MRLDPAAHAAGFSLAAHDCLGSTNAEALTLAGERRGAADRIWVTARQQTAGRGRRGNEWVSPPGNLYATLLLVDPAPVARAAELSFVTGLAVCDAVIECAPDLRDGIALKWPNDVLCGGAKVAGILIEGHVQDGHHAVAIGIGVNCRHHPSPTSYPAVNLAAAGADVAAEDLFAALSAAMMRRLAQWQRGDRFAAIRADWLGRAFGIGGDMKVRLPRRELFGRFEAIDATGCLKLRLADGTVETIAAGEVFPLSGEAAQPRPLIAKSR